MNIHTEKEEPSKEKRKEVEAETEITWRLGVGTERIHIKIEPTVLSCGELPECILEALQSLNRL